MWSCRRVVRTPAAPQDFILMLTHSVHHSVYRQWVRLSTRGSCLQFIIVRPRFGSDVALNLKWGGTYIKFCRGSAPVFTLCTEDQCRSAAAYKIYCSKFIKDFWRTTNVVLLSRQRLSEDCLTTLWKRLWMSYGFPTITQKSQRSGIRSDHRESQEWREHKQIRSGPHACFSTWKKTCLFGSNKCHIVKILMVY